MEKPEDINSNISSELARLRQAIHKQQDKDLKKRKTTDQQKTKEEMMLGVYIEELEPQVRAAVLELNRKGYPTYSSGFVGIQSELQIIEGDYKLDEGTQHELHNIGVEVIVAPSWKYKIEQHKGIIRKDLPEDAKYTTTIQFRPKTADLTEMAGKWNVIASKFPDRGHFAVSPYSKTKP